MTRTQLRVLLLALAIAVRLPLWIGYGPVVSDDTGSYERLAEQLLAWDFSKYTGARTPVYPLMLLLCGGNYTVVGALQSFVGLLTVWLVFELTLRETANPRLAFAAGIATALSLNLLLFEASILTETISAFLVVLMLWLWRLALRTDSVERSRYVFLVVGLTIGVAALTRPLLQFAAILIPALTLYAFVMCCRQWRSGLIASACVFSPALLLLLGWSAFNKTHINYFGITTLAGYSLSQHAGVVMERAPDEYKLLRDIYLKYRDPRITRTGSHSMTVWEAYPEMMSATRKSFPLLSKDVGDMSKAVLLANPGSYLTTAFEAWLRFWKAPMSPSLLAPQAGHPSLLEALNRIWSVERYLLVAVKAVFLLLAALTLFRWARSPRSISAVIIGILAIVIGASLLQAFAEYGENARYSIPFQPLVFLGIACMLGRGGRKALTRDGMPASH